LNKLVKGGGKKGDRGREEGVLETLNIGREAKAKWGTKTCRTGKKEKQKWKFEPGRTKEQKNQRGRGRMSSENKKYSICNYVRQRIKTLRELNQGGTSLKQKTGFTRRGIVGGKACSNDWVIPGSNHQKAAYLQRSETVRRDEYKKL